MNFVLVPFLLAVRLPTIRDRWMDVPEYTFNATVSTISDLEVNKGEYLGTSLLASLKCRPKEPYKLHCRFENARLTKLSPKSFGPDAAVPPNDATYTSFGFGNASFQIKFNEEGIDSYRFEDDDRLMGDYLVNMYRLIANHLSVWSKIGGVEAVKRMENTTVGECQVVYNVSKMKLDDQVTSQEFLLTWPINTDIEEAMEIRKEIILDDCLPHPVYFFGTRHTHGAVPVESIEKLQSSTGRMYISNTNFTSESISVVHVYDLNRRMIGSALDRVGLSLVSVDSAQNDFKELSDSMWAGPIIDKHNKKCL